MHFSTVDSTRLSAGICIDRVELSLLVQVSPCALLVILAPIGHHPYSLLRVRCVAQGHSSKAWGPLKTALTGDYSTTTPSASSCWLEPLR